MSALWSRHTARASAYSLRSLNAPRPSSSHPVSSPSPCLRPRRHLLTLAIESSCDDTCVAILEKHHDAAVLHFNKKVTSDNRRFHGVHPTVAVESHTRSLAPLIQEALEHLPRTALSVSEEGTNGEVPTTGLPVANAPRRRPDFVSVTRGPGMMSNLATGLNTAKGLAAAWGVPLLGVHHMQAHALTPRLVAALENGKQQQTQQGMLPNLKDMNEQLQPSFPFLSLLVSGGHSLLVRSQTLIEHQVLASARNVAVGEMLDKCGRCIIPADVVAAEKDVMYGAALEKFCFPGVASPSDYQYAPPQKREDEIRVFDSGLGWSLTPPLPSSRIMAYDFSGLNGQVRALIEHTPDMDVEGRRVLGREAMRLAFEHLASRLLFALQQQQQQQHGISEKQEVRTIVVAGGVASNKYLMHILRSMLDARGFRHLDIISPPPQLCTDNAAMIGWAAMEMYEAGWRSQMNIAPIRKWTLDSNAPDGGIPGAEGWLQG